MINLEEKIKSILVNSNQAKEFNFTIKNILINKEILVNLEIGFPVKNKLNELKQSLINEIKKEIKNIETINLNIDSKIQAHLVKAGISLIPNVKNIIAVASGKGGVGKSTTAANLALALSLEGANVGILDADIYGPNQGIMFNAQGKPESKDGKIIEPLISHEIQLMSMAFLLNNSFDALIWRGPMAVNALEQMLKLTNWQNLDYLIIDLPPGTGDIHLSLCQKTPITGAVIVTTPQDVALSDAQKAVTMFKKLNIPILGLVENMAIHICENCGHSEFIFGKDGGLKMAQELKIPFLASLPLSRQIREQSDLGIPIVLNSESSETKIYQDLAFQVGLNISKLNKNYSNKLSEIPINKAN